MYKTLFDILPVLCHISPVKFLTSRDMGYKRIDNNMTFAAMSLMSSMENNRSLKRLEKISQLVDWSQVRELLEANYSVGRSKEGADAYPPLMLLKVLLLRKGCQIDSNRQGFPG